MPLFQSPIRGATAILLGVFTISVSAHAEPTEKELLKKCEVDLCSILVDKKKEGEDLTCNLSKTWAKEDISKQAEEKKLSWSLGDSRCEVNLKIARADLVSAVSSPEYTLKVPQQSVKCEVEQGGTKYPINLTLAPVIKLKNGEATEISLGVGNIEAASVIKGVIWSAAKLEETFGIFHGDLLKETNKFITKKCPKTLAENK